MRTNCYGASIVVLAAALVIGCGSDEPSTTGSGSGASGATGAGGGGDGGSGNTGNVGGAGNSGNVGGAGNSGNAAGSGNEGGEAPGGGGPGGGGPGGGGPGGGGPGGGGPGGGGPGGGGPGGMGGQGGAAGQCGDGVQQAPEQCDGNDLQGFDCSQLGLGAGTLACDSNCAFDLSQCGPEECAPAPGDTACTACGKQYCCNEVVACYAEAECAVCAACLEVTVNPIDCFGNGSCSFSDPAASALVECAQTSCPRCF